MVNIVKEKKDNVLAVRISGSIEENVDFGQLIGEPSAEMHIYCKEVVRINSIGVKAWIKYFQTLQARNVRLKFMECSTAIVEQVNMISNFTSGGVVESLFLPFVCGNCKTELVGLFRSEDVAKMNKQIPDLKCSKCGGKASFDDIPEEYFAFLDR